MRIEIPDNAGRIVELLESSGHEAYLVGGWVRDSLLGRPGSDIDIATDAKADETTRIMEDAGVTVHPTGVRHGTVTAVVDGEPFEITTFRVDGSYSDSRHPDSVSFCQSIEDDLSRRDFTINAIAYNPRTGIVDPYGGREDLGAHLIRCVGDPDRRFGEDALRIMRALRFSAQLGFQIEDGTSRGLVEHRQLLKSISAERVGRELGLLIVEDAAADVLEGYTPVFETIIPEITPTIGMDQHNPLHAFDVWGHCTQAVRMQKSHDLATRLATLFHDLGKPLVEDPSRGKFRFAGHAEAGADLCERALRRLRFPKKVIEDASAAIRAHDIRFDDEDADVRRWLGKLGADTFFRTLDLKEADILAHSPEVAHWAEHIQDIRGLAREVLASGEPYRVQDLAIDGSDLIEAGFEPGPDIGRALDELLEAVISGDCVNGRQELLGYASGLRGQRPG